MVYPLNLLNHVNKNIDLNWSIWIIWIILRMKVTNFVVNLKSRITTKNVKDLISDVKDLISDVKDLISDVKDLISNVKDIIPDIKDLISDVKDLISDCKYLISDVKTLNFSSLRLFIPDKFTLFCLTLLKEPIQRKQTGIKLYVRVPIPLYSWRD